MRHDCYTAECKNTTGHVVVSILSVFVWVPSCLLSITACERACVGGCVCGRWGRGRGGYTMDYISHPFHTRPNVYFCQQGWSLQPLLTQLHRINKCILKVDRSVLSSGEGSTVFTIHVLQVSMDVPSIFAFSATALRASFSSSLFFFPDRLTLALGFVLQDSTWT